MPKLADYRDCTGCLACVDRCNHQALSFFLNNEGHIVPKIDLDKCVNCGLCENACPIVSQLPYTKSDKAVAFAAWAKDNDIRAKSASAGAFSAMAQFILSNGGIVCGAANVDGLHFCHICINDVSELNKLQGSKYTQSNVSGCYNEVFDYLKNGRTVLFSGTGCQVAGIYSFIGRRTYSGTLYTVDLICGGVPSRLLIDKFIESAPYRVKRIVSFRSKEYGWAPLGFKYNLKVEDTKGVIHDYSNTRNLITTGFACEMTNRYSCYQCNFAGTNRMSDFTIGDYWGIQSYKEQHYNGVSALIAHNDNALAFLDYMQDYLEVHFADLEDILSHNRRLDKCIDKRFKLIERKYMGYFFKKFSYSTLNKIYAFGFSSKSPWMLYKVYRILITKLL